MNTKNLEFLSKNLELPIKEFNLDLDEYRKKVVLDIVTDIQNMLNPRQIILTRNIYKYKKYHVKVLLNEPTNIGNTIFLRLFFGDDQKRIKFDLHRLASNVLNTFDFISDRKYNVNLKTGKKECLANYKSVPLSKR